MWLKCSTSSILSEIPEVNCSICFLIYFIKESDFHRPIIIIMYWSTFARHIAIAPPERIECVPMSLPENPRLKSCMVSTVERRALAMFRSVILYCFPFRQKLLTGESQVEPSYDKILETTLLHALTGQSVSSFDRWRFTDWFLSLFFWSSNVMLTVSANFISSADV